MTAGGSGQPGPPFSDFKKATQREQLAPLSCAMISDYPALVREMTLASFMGTGWLADGFSARI